MGAGLAFRDYSPGFCVGEVMPVAHGTLVASPPWNVVHRPSSLGTVALGHGEAGGDCTWEPSWAAASGTTRPARGLQCSSHMWPVCARPGLPGAAGEAAPGCATLSNAHRLSPSTAWIPSPGLFHILMKDFTLYLN